MTVHVATGCKSSSLRYLGHDLKVTAITGTPVLELSGAFKYRRPKGKRYKRDCAARKKADIELHNVEPRRYIVVANGERVGIFDFTQSPKRVCASAPRSPIRYLPPI